jgi:hypothetical protein
MSQRVTLDYIAGLQTAYRTSPCDELARRIRICKAKLLSQRNVEGKYTVEQWQSIGIDMEEE